MVKMTTTGQDDPVAITGIGGRYPESKNVEEFWSNLISGKELCVEDDSRWPVGYMGLPAKAGKIPGIEKFDSKFFGVTDRQANEMDPQFKICHETTFEAVIDAGLDPVDLRGSRTGMFIGYCYSDAWSAQLQVDATLYNSQWTEHFSEVSKAFGFKGPCLTYDSACASSFSAFNEAVKCIKAGVIDTAIVAGVSVSTSPVTAQGFRQLQMTSIEGQCRCMDKKANGYVRSETIASIVLQRKSSSKRIYAIVLNTITNTDGYKKEGITFPGQGSMERLMRQAYEEIGLNPVDTKYIEAHITGTSAGDPVECKAIENVFCPDDRTDPALLGCLKSNMGHPEGASGVAAITKACLILQNQLIPPNINYENPNPKIPGLFNGKLKPVLEVTKFNEKIISLNSFGFGGTNIHSIIQPFDGHDDKNGENGQENNNNINNGGDVNRTLTGKYGINRLILFKARTSASFDVLKNKIASCPNDITNESLSLVDNIANLSGDDLFPFRGYFIINNDKKIITCNWIKVDTENDDDVNNGSDTVTIKVSQEMAQHDWVKEVITIFKDADLKIVISEDDEDNLISNKTEVIKIKDIDDDSKKIEDTVDGDDDNELIVITKETSKDDILKILGNLYIDGHKIKLTKLYQCVKYPLPSTTMSVSPLISWDHSADWTVYKVPDYFRLTQKNKRLYFDYSTTHHYLTGHVIDGRIIFPAAQYLWAIWQSLAMELCDNSQMAFLSTGIKFRNVSLNRAIIVDRGDEVTLTTRVNPFTGFFEIVQDDVCLVSGHALLTYDEGVPTLGDNSDENEEEENVDMISKHDFYKELRVRGYDYEDDFQGVDECKSNGTGGTVSFIKNWVCFCDAVFQLSLINDHTRQLLIPTGFDILQIDAKVFKDISRSEFEMYEKFLNATNDENENEAEESSENKNDAEDKDQSADKDQGSIDVKEDKKMVEEKEVPKFKVTIVKETYEMFTNGMYIKGMRETLAPRRKLSPTLLKFEYHPFHETVLEDIEVRNNKSEYIESCLNIIKNIPDINMSDIIDSNNNVLDNDIKNGKSDDLDNDLHQDNEIKDEKSLIATLKKIKSENETISSEELQKHSNQLTNDILIQVPIKTATIKHQLDTVTSAFHGQSIRVTEVNISAKESIKEEVEETLKLSCPGTSYTLVSDGHSDVRTIDQHLDIKSIESELIIIQNPSLGFTFVDTNDALKERREKFLKVLNASADQMICGNFLMVITRTELTPIETSLADEDMDLLPQSAEDIINDIKTCGFIVISTKRIGSFLSILSRKPEKEGIKPEMFEIDSLKYDWVDDIRSKCYIEDGEGDHMTRRPNSNSPIWLVSKDSEISGLTGFINCVRNEDKRFHGISILDKDVPDMNSVIDECMNFNLPMTIYKDGHVGSVLATKLSDDTLPMNESEKLEAGSQNSDGQDSGFHDNENVSYVLDVETKGDLTSLKYHEATLGDSESVVDVYYSALNFKDVMVASGRVPVSAYPACLRPKNSGEMGMEFSGIDSKGNKVMGLVPTDAIATKIDVGKASDILFKVPDGMTLEEAATIPVVYSTVYYALIMRGKLINGESILIHAGSGGVGQAAINVCLSMGCEIYTTVGTKEKREFIKKTYPTINDDHIFDSRSTSFADDVLRATNGRGVDVILNSLSEDKLQSGLTCLADSGRFIEIGKYDMITNSVVDPSHFALNQTFQSVCLAFFMSKVAEYHGPDIDPDVKRLRALMEGGIKSGVVRPLSRKIFEWNQAEEAFRYMANGKHIGKILIKMRDEDNNHRSDEVIRGVRKRISFDPKKVYIVIGGLGGMGLEICFWLIKLGARKLIITSRSGAKTAYHKFCINRLRSEPINANVIVRTEDVSNIDQAKELINFANNLGPVGGIFNLAMVLKDSLFENQSKELFEECCKIKVNGTFNLDQITRTQCPELEHFVCFSSLVSTIGNAGQSNYGFANSFMDNLCTKRRADGFPGLAIGWGAIGDVGHVAECMGNDVIIAGSVPQRINSCFEVLEKVLHSNNPIVGSFIPADRANFESKGDLLGSILNVLGIKDHSKVDPKSTLGDLGLDSLMAVEIKQILEKKYEKVMSTKEIRELTIEQIKEMSEKHK